MSQRSLQTVERNSLFTRLDFRSKLVFVGVISVVAFVWESPIAGAGLALAVFLICLLSGVKWSYLKLVLELSLPLSVLLVLTHGFWNTTQVQALTGKQVLTPLFTLPPGWPLIGGGSMSLEGVLYGANVIFKMLTLVWVIPLAVFTTDLSNMIVALVRARIPYKLVFIFSSTFRFFPLLLEEAQTIIEAQRLRGLAVEKMRLFERARVYATVAVPLILGAMVRSQQLEVVLQSKAFTGSPERTYLNESVLRRADYAVILLSVLILVVAAVLYFTAGVGKFPWLLW
jgi:energy-coupling factor transport system permease protein